MAEHTPGPWEAIGTGVYAESLEIVFGAHNTRSASDDEKRANARLIAAAPAMLAALELLVEADVTEWSRDAVNAAIAQAREEVPAHA